MKVVQIGKARREEKIYSPGLISFMERAFG